MWRLCLDSRVSLVVLGFVAATLAAGCSVDESVNPAPRCGDAGTCAAPLVCHRGFCVEDARGPCIDGMSEPCWEGDGVELAGVGACRNGVRACVGGVRGLCLNQVRPTAEICNGVDDDCDRVIDEFTDEACDTGLFGACAAGTPVCQGGLVVCAPTTASMRETCNAIDDDCDGQVDETLDITAPCYPGGTQGCVLGAGAYACEGVCAAGMTRCAAGGGVECVGAVPPLSATDATCDGTDDDCDGAIDEDCSCTAGAMQDCYGGPAGTDGIGRCRSGTQTCAGGRFGDCVGETRPEVETCANPRADDDCDGMVDDVAGLGASCLATGVSGVCVDGVLACTSADAPTCSPRIVPGTQPESCNGVDDDCDGMVDEGFDLLNDRANCGICGRACGAVELCSLGACCASGTVSCGGVCLDVQSDPSNCGMCGNSCGGGACCGGRCADLASSMTDCGMCGRSCGGSQTCTNGLCCMAGNTGCGAACVNTQADATNCGACGTVCRPPNRDCCAGSCGRC